MASSAIAERPSPESAASAGRTALESGDRMERAEFERRYSRHPEIKLAELIDGVVYVASPVRIVEHADPHGILSAVFGGYLLANRGVRMASNGTWRCDDENEVQPDVLLRYLKSRGGTSWIDSDHYLRGVPELCAEITASSFNRDLYAKKELYLRLGVREYLTWQTEDGRIDWWRLEAGEYLAITPDEAGLLHSSVFEGLALNPAELLALAAETD